MKLQGLVVAEKKDDVGEIHFTVNKPYAFYDPDDEVIVEKIIYVLEDNLWHLVFDEWDEPHTIYHVSYINAITVIKTETVETVSENALKQLI